MGIFTASESNRTFHILSVEQFNPVLCAELFRRARRFEEGFRTGNYWWHGALSARLQHHIVVGWFLQQSTRTFLCFDSAAKHLGMKTSFHSDIRNISSVAKGESDEHTMQIIAGYHPSIVVIRHDRIGGVANMAQHSSVPVINAGDGLGEHPTQALLDIYTMLQERGRDNQLSHLTVAIVGDLHGRAARSLSRCLTDYGVRQILVSPEELRMGEDVRGYLRENNVQFCEEQDIEAALPYADIYYWVRTQSDQRSKEERALLAHIDLLKYQLRPEHVEKMRPDAKIMHPMPINRRPGEITEIDPAVDALPAAIYQKQAERGLYVRMALLPELIPHFEY